MLIRIRSTSTLLALCAIEGYKLFPPCSIVGKWNPAVFAIACWKFGSLVSLSVLGIAVCRPTAKLGIACGKVSPKSGFLLSLRYRVHQRVSSVSCIRFVRRNFPLDPLAELPGNVRNFSRLIGAAPFETRYAHSGSFDA